MPAENGNTSFDGTSSLHLAAKKSDLETCQLLICINPSLVKAINKDKQTPLHFASQVSIAEFLLDNNADINAPDSIGRTPLDYAATTGRADVVKFLIEKGAVIKTIYEEGFELFDCVIVCNRPDIIQMLIDAKADVGVVGHWGMTPLHSAAKTGHVHLVKMLIENGACAFQENDMGETALDYAAGNEDVLRALLNLD